MGAVRAERFYDVALKRFFETGSIEKWLYRLKEIEEKGEVLIMFLCGNSQNNARNNIKTGGKQVTMRDTSKSNSNEQQRAEVYIASAIEEWLDCPVERNAKIVLSDGVHIEPDLFSEKDRIICEIYAHIGNLKGGQPHKISQDILKMLLLEKVKAVSYRKILVVADDKVERYITGKSYIAESIRQFGIEIKRVHLPDEFQKSIMQAQIRQIMVNA